MNSTANEVKSLELFRGRSLSHRLGNEVIRKDHKLLLVTGKARSLGWNTLHGNRRNIDQLRGDRENNGYTNV